MLPDKNEKINSELNEDKQGNEIHLIIKDNLGQVLWTRSTPKLCPHFPWSLIKFSVMKVS